MPEKWFYKEERSANRNQNDIYKIGFVPILTFGMSKLGPNKKVQNLDPSHTNEISVENIVIRRQRIRNEQMKEQLQVQSVLKRAKDCQLGW